ncbi:MAG TPA: hypothetical protein VN045_00925 [Microbacteriaceae bacterium]|jgi:hypothetical protein|nr:hypothetical protein [Microbacteriaceae bacterium]HWV44874.1 hypothetical protein [Nitrospira sp.]
MSASGPADRTISSLSLEQAKHAAQKMEDTIAGLVPDEYVAKSEQAPKGTLLSCSKDSYQWSGQTDVYLEGSPDVDRILDRIADHWKGDDNYTIKRDTAANNTPRLTLSGAHGAGYIVNPTRDNSHVQILSFSPCFRLPDDVYPGGTF